MRKRLRFSVGAALLAAAAIPAEAEVEQHLARVAPLPAEARDVAVTADGQRTYVLLDGGTVQVLNAAGAPLGQVTVPAETTAIAPSPDGARLYVTAGKELRVIGVDLVHQIEVAGSPVLGAADAPVTVTVFNDFQ